METECGNSSIEITQNEKYIPQSKKKKVKYLDSGYHTLGDIVESRYCELDRNGTNSGY